VTPGAAIIGDGLPFSVIACTLLVSGPPKLPQGTVPAGRFLVLPGLTDRPELLTRKGFSPFHKRA
jgi:hypothetical protein